MNQGKHLTREEKRRAQQFRANLLGLTAALLLVTLGVVLAVMLT